MPKPKKDTRSRRKGLYRVRNWSEYDQALVERGSITIRLSDDFEQVWCYRGPTQPGGQYDYSERAIEIMLSVKNVFHLSNRAAEGFVGSLFKLLGDQLPVPDHTTLTRQGKTLKVALPKKVNGHLDIVMDSTGVNGKCERTESQNDVPGASYIWVLTARQVKSRPQP